MRGSLKYEFGVGGMKSITTALLSAMEAGPRQIQGFKGSQKMRGSLNYEAGVGGRGSVPLHCNQPWRRDLDRYKDSWGPRR